MKQRFLKILIVINLILFTTIGHSQFIAQLDQDLFDAVGRNEDRNYTMGLQFMFPSNKFNKLYFFSNNVVKEYGNLLLFEKRTTFDNRASYTTGFGAVGFTPDSLNTYLLINNDRPYSSLIFLSFGNQIINDLSTKAIKTQFTVGMMGLSIAEHVQTGIHIVNRAINGKETPYDPLGWDNQVSDGGYLVLQYSINPKFDVGTIFGQQLRLDYKLDIGNYINAISTEAIVFIGKPLSSILTFDSNIIGSLNTARNTEKDKDKKYSFFGFLSANPSFILYNRSITGQPDIPAKLNNFVSRFNAGLVLEWKKQKNQYSIVYSQNIRTPEFTIENNKNKRWHSWGTITFSSTPNNRK